jgi:RNA polymerase sigma-70 factor (ECF subfamily)
MGTTDQEQAIRAAFEVQQLALAARIAFQSYGDEILSFLMTRLRNPSDAHEVFSMFAEDLWTGLGGFGWRCSVRTWLYTLARNATSRYLLSPHKKGERNLSLAQLESRSAVEERLRSATGVYQQTAIKDRFRLLREQLAEDDQTLLILRVDRGMSFRDLSLAMSGDAELDEPTLAREAARHRKAFERVKTELRELAEREGLLPRGGG